MTGHDHRAQLEQLHQRLVDGVRAISTGDDWRAWLQAASRFHQYSFSNIMLIHLQRPDATRVAGYTTWKKLGRQVNKGERGIQILAPVLARTRHEPEPGDDEPARTARQLIGVRRTYVWDVSQTSGPPLPQPPRPAVIDGAAPVGLWDALAQQVTDTGFTFEPEAIPDGGAYGYTNYTDRRIVVADRLGPADAVATLAHEVAHMLMHNQHDFPDTTRACRGVREVEAESVAYVVTAQHGLVTDNISFPYVATWASAADNSDPERIVQEAGQRVITIARRVIHATGSDLESSELDIPDQSIRRPAPAVEAGREQAIPTPDVEQGDHPCI